MDFPSTRPWICLALALLPAAWRFWRGRRLLRVAPDPLLPERYVQAFSRPGLAEALPLAVAIALAWNRAPLILGAVAVWVLGRLAAAFPVRRALFGETWGLFAYLAFWIRARLALQLAWLGVLAAPALVLASPAAQRGPVAGAIVILLLILFFAQRRLLRLAFNARSCARTGLVELCRAVTAQSRLAAGVTLYEGGPRGGRWANALALPAVREPGVLFSCDLLDSLTPAEVQAIFAHEVAHLEHFHPARLRRSGSLTTALIVLGTVLVPVLATAGGPELETGLPLLWAGGLLIALGLRARRRRPQETASDLRALELGADPEALISGLAKTYALARIPRRWDPALDRQSTHPSLARRIQDLRRAAKLPLPVVQSRAFAADDGSGGWVEFESDRLHWLTGVSAEVPAAQRRESATRRESLEYGRLCELRVAPRGERAVLRATDLDGGARELPIGHGDLPALQTTLDAVDSRLGVARAAAASPLWGRLLGAIAVAAVGVPGGSWALALAGLGVLLLPGAGAAAALCAGFAGSALLLVRLPVSGPQLGLLLAGNLVLAFGALLFWRGEAAPAGARRAETTLRWLLGLGWIWAWAVVAAAGVGSVTLHESLGDSGSAVLAPLLLAAACAASGRARVRRAAWVPGLAAAAALLLGSTNWRGVWMSDPLLAVGAGADSPREALAPEASFDLPLELTALSLAPDGEHYLARTDEEEEDDEPSARFWVGRTGAPPVAVDAVDAIFLDSTRLLAIRADAARGSNLVVLPVEAPATPAWSLAVGELTDRALGAEPASGGASWSVLGRAKDRRHLILRRGNADGAELPAVRWDLDERPPTGTFRQWIPWPAGAFGTRQSYGGPADGWRSFLAQLQRRKRLSWRLEAVRFPEPGAPRTLFETALSARCLAGGPGGVLCLALSDGETALWILEGDTRRLAGVLPGEVEEVAANRERLLVSRRGGRVEIVDLGTGARTSLQLPAADSWPLVGLGDRRAAVAVSAAKGVRVHLYTLPAR